MWSIGSGAIDACVGVSVTATGAERAHALLGLLLRWCDAWLVAGVMYSTQGGGAACLRPPSCA